MNTEHFLQLLQALELELHHPGVPCSRERLEQLLHLDFHEVGRSGRPYDRDTVLRYLASVSEVSTVVSEHFALTKLAPGCALLTYRSCLPGSAGDPASSLHTHRASLWRRGEAGWQLVYHQGTPAAEPF